MKTRIAVYSPTKNFYGGSFQYAKALTRALGELDAERYEIRVWHEEDSEWNELCQNLGFAEEIIGEYTIPPTMAPAIKKIYETLQKLPPEDITSRKKMLMHLQPFSSEAKLQAFDPNMVICPQMTIPPYHKGAKHIGVIHDLMHRYESRFPEVGTPQEIAGRENLFQNIIAICDTILVDSKIGKQHVLECYPQAKEEQIQILPFAAFPEVLEATPRKPNFELPDKFLFYPAQFWLHKNHVGLAKAVALLKEKYPDIVIVAAGNTKQNGFKPFMEIVERENLQKNFRLPGYIDVKEMNWLYRHARALVMPTFLGPTNIPPLEAMALGCPVAVSGVYGMPDQCGDGALYLNPADSKNIADVLIKLWVDDELCAQLVKKGQERGKWYNYNHFSKLVVKMVRQQACQY